MKVRIVSPAKAIEGTLIDNAVSFLTKNGFDATVSENAKGQRNYFSGEDGTRLTDIQHAIDDFEVDVILCARGGYGCVRIVDRIDFSSLKRKQKLICGFSDITVFHSHIHSSLGLPTVHCTVPLNFGENSKEALDSLLNVLHRNSNEYSIAENALNRNGEANAVIVGGNLSILTSLIGTKSDLQTDGKILFIEDIGEPVYKIDRMMQTLKRSGKLSQLAALIVGGMTDVTDSAIPFGKSVQEVIAESVGAYKYPLCFDFPAGHISDNRALVLGKKAQISIGTKVLFRQAEAE